MSDSEEQESGIYIEGAFYTMDRLTYREQREIRTLVRQLNEDDPTFDSDDVATIDLVPAIVYVIKRRDNPEYSMNEALDLSPADLEPPAKEPEGAKKRPTRAAAKS